MVALGHDLHTDIRVYSTKWWSFYTAGARSCMPVPPSSHSGTYWHSCEQVLVLDTAHVWCVHRHAQAGTWQYWNTAGVPIPPHDDPETWQEEAHPGPHTVVQMCGSGFYFSCRMLIDQLTLGRAKSRMGGVYSPLGRQTLLYARQRRVRQSPG